MRGPGKSSPTCTQVDSVNKRIKLHDLQPDPGGGGGGGARADPASASDFFFDSVLPSNATQDEVYAVVGPGVVMRAVKQGVHSTFLAYGQTSSGKTHTTIGGSGAVRINTPRERERESKRERARAREREREREKATASRKRFQCKQMLQHS